MSASEDTTVVAVDARSGLPAILVTPTVTPPTRNRQRNQAEKRTNNFYKFYFCFQKMHLKMVRSIVQVKKVKTKAVMINNNLI